MEPPGQDVPDGQQMPERIQLSTEELKVMQECRRESMVKRGLPAAILSGLAARFMIHKGYLKNRGLTYIGFVTLGFWSGVGSYAETCKKKLMALENSQIGDMIRQGYQKHGLPIPDRYQTDTIAMPPPKQGDDEMSHLFNHDEEKHTVVYGRDVAESSRETTTPNSNSKWEDIRRESRKAKLPPPPEYGLSYDELRRRNRSMQSSNYKSLTPEEEADLERKMHAPGKEEASEMYEICPDCGERHPPDELIDEAEICPDCGVQHNPYQHTPSAQNQQELSDDTRSFNAASFSDNKSSSALDFSKSDDSRSAGSQRQVEKEEPRKSNRGVPPRTNKYGDEIM